MKAAWYERNGPAVDVLTVGTMDTPRPQPGEVLVRVHASGVNPSDVKSRKGRPLTAPRIIPHSDGAGIIEDVGPDVDPARVVDGMGHPAPATHPAIDAQIQRSAGHRRHHQAGN